MPNLYLSGTPSGTLGGEVGVLLSGVTYMAIGQITADSSGVLEEGRKPLTIVVKISLLSGVQSVQAVWTVLQFDDQYGHLFFHVRDPDRQLARAALFTWRGSFVWFSTPLEGGL